MAKDFDFVRRPVTQPPVANPAKEPAPTEGEVIIEQTNLESRQAEFFPTPHRPKKNVEQKRQRRYAVVGWGVVVLIVGTVVALTYLYYQSLQKPASSNTSVDTSQNVAAVETLKATVYDRGAGTTKAAEVVTKVNALDISTELGAQSSLTYDQSYIFYKTGEIATAQKIVTALTGYTLELRESPLPGISIYLGKN